jgi:hypothetical protein
MGEFRELRPDSQVLRARASVRFLRAGISFTIASASLGALTDLIWWIDSEFLGSGVVWAFLIGFVLAFFYFLPLVAFLWTRTFLKVFRGQEVDQRPRRLLEDVPKRWVNYVIGVIVVCIGSSIAGFIEPGGYSQGPETSNPSCRWVIGTNHGLTNLCVSHARWVATGQDFYRAGFDFMTLFLIITSALYTGQLVLARQYLRHVEWSSGWNIG